jgi:flagellar assembly factor FliW
MRHVESLDGVVTFAEGLPGFETCRQFILVGSPALQPFTVVRGVEDDGPAFVAIDPRRLSPDYAPRLDRSDLARLEADPNQPLLWLALVAAGDDGTATANLRAPLVINPAAMRGIQLIVIDSPYSIAYPLKVA